MNATLCAWWAHRQGLDGSLAGASAAEVLAGTGWARSAGGSAPYLTLFARAGIRREEADAALAAMEIHELPCARACTHVVPAVDYALALAVGQPFADRGMKVARKLGVTEAEIAALCDAVIKGLDQETLDPEALRKKVGDAARNLGPEGTKKGVTTTLPLALTTLQSEGRIRRVPVNGRLDQQRYRYQAWKPSPLAKWKQSAEESFTELAGKYFSWTGPATLKEFQWFSGLAAGAAKAAVAPLGLVDIDGRLLLPGDADAFRKFKIPKQSQYVLVSSLDNIGLLRRDLPSMFAPADLQRVFVSAKTSLSYLPSHAILDRGRVVGLWEFDSETGTIAWLSFVPRDRKLEAAVETMEAFVREDLGDARSFSLDTPASRAPRIQALRAAASK